MSRMFRTLSFALAFTLAGFAVATSGIVDRPAAAQQPSPSAPSGQVPGGQAPPGQAPGAKATVRDQAAALEADIKPLLDKVGKKVEGLEQQLNKLADEARAKAVTYALWAAAGLFVLMFVASLLGGAVAVLLLRRSRES